MISNPCSWSATGGSLEDVKSFTYTTGDRQDFSNSTSKEYLEAQILKQVECARFLWHFSPRANGLSTAMENNIVWFANDAKQAMEILREMFEFRIKCAIEYHKYNTEHQKRLQHGAQFAEEADNTAKGYREYLKKLDEGTLVITMASTNQFYQVGWAMNDTLH